MDAEQRGRLKDILHAARLASGYVQGVSEVEFRANFEKQDAVIRRLEIIGEAAVHLSETTRASLPDLQVRMMRGMRNIVAHDYANVDLKIVWEVATVHLPEVGRVLERYSTSVEGKEAEQGSPEFPEA